MIAENKAVVHEAVRVISSNVQFLIGYLQVVDLDNLDDVEIEVLRRSFSDINKSSSSVPI